MQLLEPWQLAFVLDVMCLTWGDRRSATARLREPPQPGHHFRDRVRRSRGAAALASYLMTICFALAGNRVLTQARAEIYRHLDSLSMRFHDRRRTGDLVTRVTATSLACRTLWSPRSSRWWAICSPARHGGGDRDNGLAAGPGGAGDLAVFALSSTRLARKIVDVSRGQRSGRCLASLATETLSSMAVVQSYSLEDRLEGRFASSDQRSLKDGVKGKKLSAGLERKTDVLVGIGTALVLAFGAFRVLQGQPASAS